MSGVANCDVGDWDGIYDRYDYRKRETRDITRWCLFTGHASTTPFIERKTKKPTQTDAGGASRVGGKPESIPLKSARHGRLG